MYSLPLGSIEMTVVTPRISKIMKEIITKDGTLNTSIPCRPPVTNAKVAFIWLVYSEVVFPIPAKACSSSLTTCEDAILVAIRFGANATIALQVLQQQ